VKVKNLIKPRGEDGADHRKPSRQGELAQQLRWVEACYRRGELGTAIAGARKLVQAARGGNDELFLARALNLLGIVGKEVGHHRRSEACYRQALPIFVRALGRSHPALASVYHNLGGILYARGCLADAERWARRAVAHRIDALGRHHGHVIADKASLAVILAARGKKTEAEAIYRRAIRWYSTRQRVPYEVAINSSNLGVLLASSERYRAAELAFRRAIDTYRSMRHAPPHDLALALHNLGVLRAEAGDGRAVRLLEQAHELFLTTLGARHPWTRMSRRRLLGVEAAVRVKKPMAAGRETTRIRRPRGGSARRRHGRIADREVGGAARSP